MHTKPCTPSPTLSAPRPPAPPRATHGAIAILLFVYLGLSLSAQNYLTEPLALPTLGSQTLQAGSATTVTGKGRGSPAEWTQGLGIALTFYQGNYWESDEYSMASYEVSPVRFGALGDLQAWRISPPSPSTKLKFVASGNEAFIRLPSSTPHTAWIWRDRPRSPDSMVWANGAFERLGPLERSSGTDFAKVPDLRLDQLQEAIILVLAPSNQDLSPLGNLAPGVRGARLSGGASSALRLFEFAVPEGNPANGADTDAGPPDLTYARIGRLPASHDGAVYTAWQDPRAQALFVTSFAEGPPKTIRLPFHAPRLFSFLAWRGSWYFLTGADGTNPKTELIRTDQVGKILARTTLSNAQNGFNIHSFGNDVASLAGAGNLVGLILGRTMQKGSDGLNHQGSIAAVFEAGTLALVRNFGQNSGHSFDSRLIADGDGFVSLDLGDNYPRGVILHRMSATANPGAVVFTFKTWHGTTPSPYRANLPAGRWSNDNRTYTELGDVVSLEAGYGVLVASEKSTDNSQAKQVVNESRNLAWVLVKRDFKASGTSPLVSPEVVISPGGPGPQFGFYTFDGDFVPQQNRGVVWLTDYRDPKAEHATRAKALTLDPSRVLILWERWSASAHLSTHGMIIAPDGKTLAGPWDFGHLVRLPLSTRPVLVDSRVVWFLPGANRIRAWSLDLPELTGTALPPAATTTAPATPPVTPGPASTPPPTTTASPGFPGSWFSTWGDGNTVRLTINQEGVTLRGRYNPGNGTLEGTVRRSGTTPVYSGTWTEGEATGWFAFTLAPDGLSFTGQWGYEDGPAEGNWNGTKP